MWFSSLFIAKAFHYRDVEVSTRAYYDLFFECGSWLYNDNSATSLRDALPASEWNQPLSGRNT